MDPTGIKRLFWPAGSLGFCCLFVGECVADELASALRQFPVADVRMRMRRAILISGRIVIIVIIIGSTPLATAAAN